MYLENQKEIQGHVAISGHATWHADVSITSSRGSAPADVSMSALTGSTLIGQQSAGQRGQPGPPVGQRVSLTDGAPRINA